MHDKTGNSPVEAVFHQAEEEIAAAQQRVQRLHADWEQQAALLVAEQARIKDLEERNRSLTLALEASRRQVADARQKAQEQRERAARFSHLLHDLQQSMTGGALQQWILRACLTITEATRGLYVTANVPGGSAEIQAVVGMGDVSFSSPSERISALCRSVLEGGEPFVAQSAVDLTDLPPAASPEENFSNCIAAPVMFHKQSHGAVLVCDKRSGTFDDDDVQSLLHVGAQAVSSQEHEHLRRHLQNAYLATVYVLADAMEAKDPYTQGHCDMVSVYADRIAKRLHLSERDRSIVSYAALLHDIGKIGVSDGVLNKPGPLLPEERALVRSHVRVGSDLLRHVPVLEPVADVVLHHHERWDGCGYPDGLRGEEIPMAARIVSVVDAYSAMITRRSYKEALPKEHAAEELRACAGTQFDPAVVYAFLAVLDEPVPEAQRGLDRDTWLRPLEALFQPPIPANGS